MTQAKRKTRARKKSSGGQSFYSLGMLVSGIIIGSLGTVLWQGMRAADGGVGTGIRQMIEQSKQQDDAAQRNRNISETDKPVKQQTNFDFFTVLPEIEVVVPNVEPEQPTAQSVPVTSTDTSQVAKVIKIPTKSVYMLQAGSYQNKADADRLKAELALKGHSSTIQKVTIQGRGDFYRVRLGPFTTHSDMVNVDNSLSGEGIKALRLKISKGA